MKFLKHPAVYLAFLVIVSLSTAYGVRKYHEQTIEHTGDVSSDKLIGKTAPNFILKRLSGDTLKLSDYQGKWLLLNFWASWCSPCREEIPGFINIQKKYQQKDFTFIGVAIEDEADVKKYADEVQINYPITHGVEAAYNVSAKYGNPDGMLPYTVLIDPKQKIRAIYNGLLHENKLDKLLNEHIKRK